MDSDPQGSLSISLGHQQTVNFLQEHKLLAYSDLEEKAKKCTATFDELNTQIDRFLGLEQEQKANEKSQEQR